MNTVDFHSIFYVILICEEIHVEIDTYKWVSDCCLIPTQQIFSYIMASTS